MSAALFTFGSSPILPSRHEYNTRTLNLPFDPLATARLLEAEIKRLEDLCEASKQRRDEKQADVAALDRQLTSLRAQEHNEAEITRKLSKAYARACGVDTTRPGVMSLVQAYSSTFGSLWDLARTLGPPDSPPRSQAPSPDTPDSPSPFDEFHECYMDSYVRPSPPLQHSRVKPSLSFATTRENPSTTGMAAYRSDPKARAPPRAVLGDKSNVQRKRSLSLTDTDLANTIEDFHKMLRFNTEEQMPLPNCTKRKSRGSYARRW